MIKRIPCRVIDTIPLREGVELPRRRDGGDSLRQKNSGLAAIYSRGRGEFTYTERCGILREFAESFRGLALDIYA